LGAWGYWWKGVDRIGLVGATYSPLSISGSI
jgi:hypothetical protein